MTKILSIALLLFSFSLYAQKNNQIIDKSTKYSSSQDSIILSPVLAIPIKDYISKNPKSISTKGIENQTSSSVEVSPVNVSLVNKAAQTSIKSTTNNSKDSNQSKENNVVIEMPAINVVKYQEENTINSVDKIITED
jgi:hypothetical protein